MPKGFTVFAHIVYLVTHYKPPPWRGQQSNECFARSAASKNHDNPWILLRFFIFYFLVITIWRPATAVWNNFYFIHGILEFRFWHSGCRLQIKSSRHDIKRVSDNIRIRAMVSLHMKQTPNLNPLACDLRQIGKIHSAWEEMLTKF